jgi:hypothetical protein
MIYHFWQIYSKMYFQNLKFTLFRNPSCVKTLSRLPAGCKMSSACKMMKKWVGSASNKPIVLGGQPHSKVILFKFSLKIFKFLLLFVNHNFILKYLTNRAANKWLGYKIISPAVKTIIVMDQTAFAVLSLSVFSSGLPAGG